MGIVAALALCGAGVVEAQVDVEGPQLRGGIGYFGVGTQGLGISGFNTALKSNAYSTFSGSALSLGGGAMAVRGRWILGGEGETFLEKSGSGTNVQTKLSGGYWLANLGYVAFHTKKLLLYPLVGFGRGGLNFRVKPKTIPDFNTTLATPQQGASLDASGWLLNVALGADYLIAREEREGGPSWALGVRAGYMFAPTRPGWHLEEDKISGGPSARITGPYIRFQVGIGTLGTE